MKINETLKMLRSIYGLTGKELAKSLQISTSYLSEIENGKKSPSLDLLEKYSTVFDIKLSTLILFTEEQSNNNFYTTAKTKTRDTLFRFIKFLDSIQSTEARSENEQETNSIST